MKKNHGLHNAKRMIFVLFLIFILTFSGLVIRLGNIMIGENHGFEKRVVAQQIKQKTYSHTIEPKRGAIKDRNGISLAESIRVYDLIYDCKFINALDEEEIDKINVLLSENIEDVTISKLEDLLRDKPNSQYQPLLKNQRYEDVQEIYDGLANGEIKRGISFQESFNRIYPYNDMACTVLGFVNVNGGLVGTERYYDEILSGEQGRMFGIIDGEKVVQEEVPAKDGMDIELTIDFTIQKYVEEAIENYANEHEQDRVSAIVMDPNTGEVLAMASYPDFDLNNPYDLSQLYKKEIMAGMTPEELNEPYDLSQLYKEKVLPDLTSDERNNQSNNLWKNHLVSSTYEPGSTYKSFVLATGLEEGIIELDDQHTCHGEIVVDKWTIQCFRHKAHGELTVKEALKESCNVTFIEIGDKIGKDLFYKYHYQYGFGAKTGIDLLGEVRGITKSYNKFTFVDVANGSIGQGSAITPIQLVTNFSALVNGGKLYKPHVMRRVIDGDGMIIERKEAELIRQVISKETSAEVALALHDAIREKEYHTAAVEGYQIGGKTGTGQQGARDSGNEILSFIGAAPIYNPEVVTLVVIDKPKDKDYTSYLAAGVFADIMEKVLPYKKIFPVESEPTQERNIN